MDLDVVFNKASEGRGAFAGMMKLIGRVKKGEIEGEALTPGQKSNIKQKGLDKLQKVKDVVAAIEAEIGV